MSGAADAVAWHSKIAAQFDERYSRSTAFRERLAVWSELIGIYGGPDKTVLDAGCGSGVLTGVAARSCASVVGFDASPDMLAIAEQRMRAEQLVNVELLDARLPNLAFLGERRFDLVMSSSVLEYMDDLWRTIDALAERTAPGGMLLVSLPNGASLYRRGERLAYQLTGWPRYFAYVKHMPMQSTITEGLVRCGFTIEDVRYYGSSPGLSRVGRRLGLARVTDHLFVVAARKRRQL